MTHYAVYSGTDQRSGLPSFGQAIHISACRRWSGYTAVDGEAVADASAVDCPKCRETTYWQCAADGMAAIIEPLIVVTDDETAGDLDTCASALEIAAALRAAGYELAERKASEQ